MKIDFSADRSLFELPIVWWCGGIPLVLAFVSFTMISVGLSEVGFCFDSDGFNNFASYFKVPAAFAAIGFTLVGICAANHRSEQSRVQIIVSTSQNRFTNHYKHAEEFEKYCKAYHEDLEGYIAAQKEKYKKSSILLLQTLTMPAHFKQIRYRSIHERIYPESRHGSFEISSKYKMKMEEIIDEVLSICESFGGSDIQRWQRAVISLADAVDNYVAQSFIVVPFQNYTKFLIEDEQRSVPFGDASMYLVMLRGAIETQVHALEFDGQYVSSDKIKRFLNLDLVGLTIDVESFSALPYPKKRFQI